MNALFTELLYGIIFDNRAKTDFLQSKRKEKIQKIITFIDANLDKELSLIEISKLMNMPQSSLCHLFKDEMKLSLKQFILQKKMAYAKTLLQQGKSPGETAVACGYRNYTSFYKIYTKAMGNAPSARF